MNFIRKRFLFVPILFCIFSLTGLKGASGAGEGRARALRAERYLYVSHVVDGDTVVVSGGEKVRYIGIDTPEFGEPFFKEARQENLRLVGGKRIRLVECRGEKRDKYGRTLAWVYADGVFVNGRLLSEGLAKTLIIPPCGLEKLRELKALEKRARKAGKGIWGLKRRPKREVR